MTTPDFAPTRTSPDGTGWLQPAGGSLTGEIRRRWAARAARILAGAWRRLQERAEDPGRRVPYY